MSKKVRQTAKAEVKKAKKNPPAEKQLENLIEKTLREAYLGKDLIEDLKGASHRHSEVFQEEIENNLSKQKGKNNFSEKKDNSPSAKENLKIPGLRQADGSACCGGGCCSLPNDQSKWEPELNKKEYLDIINQVLDPETGVGITDMGLIYDVEEHPDGLINVTMTLTSMGCPAGGQITTEIDAMLRLQPHVTEVKIEVVWEPPWNPEMMNPEVKAMLFGN